ncbi:MAG: tRNA (adenosine(37)-N6)-threonylcarbamoyltransferase complex transferase subunit TsaD, partial [Verrucomicrobiota bacterium]|nr:tRNA (adenosine(37)-N6)-threonylcarbamoyltransferase complex transferase subunit TsaD [Verrucomicrobiota bacterium]
AAAKALALVLRVPVVGVNHLRAHAWSPFIALHGENPSGFDRRLAGLLPHLGLIASGGHTLLFELDKNRRVTVLASTRDDAAGEALDKGAKMLGLGYPGGPLIEKLAENGRADAYDFPRGIARRDELDFSFSGLKTSLRYLLEKMTLAEAGARQADLCASYQQTVVGTLARKTGAALERGPSTGSAGSGQGYSSLGLSGGVGNNRALRAVLGELARENGLPFLAAQPQHAGDNAGMVAFAAWVDAPGTDARGLDLGIEPSLALG